MFHYGHASDYVIDRVRFHYKGANYRGRGLLKWHPETHWHLDAHVDRDREKPAVEEFGKLVVLTSMDLASIHLEFAYGQRAYIPPSAIDDAVLSTRDLLSLDVPRVVFFGPAAATTPRGSDQAEILLRFGKLPMLPDSVRTEKWVAEKSVGYGLSREGMRIQRPIENHRCPF